MATASPKKKASPKAKTRKTAARSTTTKSTAAKKTAAKKTTANSTRKTAPKAAPVFAAKAQENARNVFLAGLGFYGKAFEQAQSQLESAQTRLNQRREKVEGLFSDLVKHGEKVETDAKKAIKDIDLPELKMAKPEDIRKEVQARLEKARESFETLRGSLVSKAA